ncbi:MULTISPECIES: bacterio-opsin activator domain-containing protein [unclassified Haladaptatus]|uniref:helix-turn-helix domain-containing protein n=1 Tax=unclassified Haladaptatus TaxID=2622732 RepID=UPI00209C516E|nr:MULTISPECIES: bacterio-opsin activator domain-containing protein [unclassified Haladaptatus]MCO8244248.1 helix-turn-helix domain-containing protein [Haladaptatus sp. AB643]MCO8254126.1 helix-turn-helix domain-containing protein [Haladaptatus sp. AB618]
MVGTVVEVEIPADEFALWETLMEHENIEFEIERVVAHESKRVMPFVWASGGEGDMESILEEDTSVENLQLLADLDEEQLYQMEWTDRIQTLIHILVDEEATVLSASGNSNHWHLRILFPDRDALSDTYDYCRENDLTLDIRNIYELEQGRKGRFGLTDEQQDTLTLAFERGYYDIPREASAENLAGDLDVSHQAISERLRRGHRSLVKNTLIIGRNADEPQ